MEIGMSGPLYQLLIKLGVPASIAAAIIGAAMMLMGCAGESVVVRREPNTVVVPSSSVNTTVTAPEAVPQK